MGRGARVRRARRGAVGHSRLHAVSVVVLFVTLVATALASAGAWVSGNDTEQRLLDDRTAGAGALLRSLVLSVQTPLASTAELVESADGDPDVFSSFLGPDVGETTATEQPMFVAAAVFSVDGGPPIATLGADIALMGGGAPQVDAMVERTLASPGVLTVVDVLELGGRRLGYAWASTAGAPRYVVYAEAALPRDPTAVPRAPGPYEDLHFALYLGAEPRSEGFLYSSTADLPLSGRISTTAVPFGDSELLLVMEATGPMAGRLAQVLPWVIGGLGLLLALGLAALVERLLRERDGAHDMAVEIGGLYAEQRRIADTLQRSLLPPRLVAPPGLTVVSRYWPASDETSVGGDFYDVFQIDDDRWGVVIGDVCGKGVEAAALTALTRHTIRAAARHTSSPTRVLLWAHEAIAGAHGGATFATACFAVVTRTPGSGTGVVLHLALGGHERPLLCRADGTVEAIGRYGSLLGVVEPVFHETVHHLDAGDRLLLFTDGVTDAPGREAITLEALAEALERAHVGVVAPLGDPRDAEQLADGVRRLVEDRRPAGLTDDTALLVLAVDPLADDTSEVDRAADVADVADGADGGEVDDGSTRADASVTR